MAKRINPRKTLRRLDSIIICDSPATAQTNVHWSCKRIYGLPEEVLELREGDLFISGRRFQKSLNQMMAVAIPVTSIASSRDSLSSVPAPAWADVPLRTGESLTWNYQVCDDYPENATTPRNLATVDDLLFLVEFEKSAANPNDTHSADPQSLQSTSAQALITLQYRGRIFEFQCLFKPADFRELSSGEMVSSGEEPKLLEWAGQPTTIANPQRIYCGGWDNQMFCGWDQARLIPPFADIVQDPSDRYQPTGPATENQDYPTSFSIVVQRGSLHVKQLTVMRDLYLRMNERDSSNGNSTSVRLGQNQYFVIGDNLPISRDSRNGLGFIHRRHIWGVID